MGDFDGIEEAQSTKTSNYILAGDYPVLFINALKKIRSQRNGAKLFIAEIDILKSLVDSRPAGTDMSWIVNLTKHGKTALGNVKGLLAALLDVDENEVDAKTADLAVSAENPFHGRLVRCSAVEITTSDGAPFTKPNWHPLPMEMQAQALELHSAAGFGTIAQEVADQVPF